MKSAGNCIEPTPKNLECHNSPRQTIRCTRPRTAVKCKLFPSKVSGDRKSVEISLVSVLGWASRRKQWNACAIASYAVRPSSTSKERLYAMSATLPILR